MRYAIAIAQTFLYCSNVSLHASWLSPSHCICGFFLVVESSRAGNSFNWKGNLAERSAALVTDKAISGLHSCECDGKVTMNSFVSSRMELIQNAKDFHSN